MNKLLTALTIGFFAFTATSENVYHSGKTGFIDNVELRSTVSQNRGSKASGQNAAAFGQSANATNDNSFVWNGDSTVDDYGSHDTAGTFNVNPVNGLGGFYIGNTLLSELLNTFDHTNLCLAGVSVTNWDDIGNSKDIERLYRLMTNSIPYKNGQYVNASNLYTTITNLNEIWKVFDGYVKGEDVEEAQPGFTGFFSSNESQEEPPYDNFCEPVAQYVGYTFRHNDRRLINTGTDGAEGHGHMRLRGQCISTSETHSPQNPDESKLLKFPVPESGDISGNAACSIDNLYDPLAGAEKFTIMAWIYRNDESYPTSGRTASRIISDAVSSTGGNGFDLRFAGQNKGNVELYVNGTKISSAFFTSGSDTAYAGCHQSSRTWYHIAIAYNGTNSANDNVVCYISTVNNDTIETTKLNQTRTLHAGAVRSNQNEVYIGGSSANNTDNGQFVGYIDDVMLFKDWIPADSVGTKIETETGVVNYWASLNDTTIQQPTIYESVHLGAIDPDESLYSADQIDEMFDDYDIVGKYLPLSKIVNNTNYVGVPVAFTEPIDAVNMVTLEKDQDGEFTAATIGERNTNFTAGTYSISVGKGTLQDPNNPDFPNNHWDINQNYGGQNTIIIMPKDQNRRDSAHSISISKNSSAISINGNIIAFDPPVGINFVQGEPLLILHHVDSSREGDFDAEIDGVVLETTVAGAITKLEYGVRPMGAVGPNSIALGTGCLALEEASLAIGGYSVALKKGSQGIGDNCYAYEEYARAGGAHSTAAAKYSRADGDNCYTAGDYSYAGGHYAQASNKYGYAYGNHVIAAASNSMAIGRCVYNTNEYAYVWNGDYTISETNDSRNVSRSSDGGDAAVTSQSPSGGNWAIDDYYGSHGPGTFNINPAGGIDGFYIGNAKLLDSLNLANVATSGSYADLNSVPTELSDFNNDTGYITANDIPAQVQSDWEETDSASPAYIANKPEIISSNVVSEIAQYIVNEMAVNGWEVDGTWYKLVVQPFTPPPPAKTTFTLSDGTKDIIDISGTLNQQWMIDHGYYDNGWKKTITQAEIGTNVTSVEKMAFYNCYSLMSVTIPDNVTNIGNLTFWYCTNLTNVVIGNSVTNIGSSAFRECRGLTNIVIPDSVTYIDSEAFDGCHALTSVTIGDSVTFIGNAAFSHCTGLTSVTIPDSVTKVWYSAFYYCTNLTNVTIGNGVTFIGGGAFASCSSLANGFVDMNSKTVAYVQAMSNYSWSLPSGCVIHCSDGDITIP